MSQWQSSIALRLSGVTKERPEPELAALHGTGVGHSGAYGAAHLAELLQRVEARASRLQCSGRLWLAALPSLCVLGCSVA